LPASAEKPFPEKGAIRRALLRWYASHQRDLPWRKNRDAYRILVSEFMLQQTRVETVRPYFERFLKLFPTLPALARASLQSVLKAWAGLGYYARARHLHSAAKIIWRDHGGKIPSSKKELLALPGFGPYTAGAMASLAFNEPAAAIDGNVKRFLDRLLNSRQMVSTSNQRKLLEKVVEDLIPPGRASDFNQAMMDLGNLVCIPARPRCLECPVRRICASRGRKGQGRQRKVKKIRKEIWVVALVEQEGRFLLHRKEGQGLLAGLWQFPTVVLEREGNSKEGKKRAGAREREALKRALQERFGLRVKMKGALPIQEHQFTHLDVILKPALYSLVKLFPSERAPQNIRWIKPSRFSHYPISRAMGKIAGLILDRPAKIPILS
jgi:A/G-specific adenine glycosylase